MAAKYQVVLGELSRQIETMQPGDQLPTEESLVERFGVSPMTVRRALQALGDAKRTIAVRGRGAFVAPRTVSKRMTLTSFTMLPKPDCLRGSRSAQANRHPETISGGTRGFQREARGVRTAA